eukprot:4845223-Prymnesium_polylepis.1
MHDRGRGPRHAGGGLTTCHPPAAARARAGAPRAPVQLGACRRSTGLRRDARPDGPVRAHKRCHLHGLG